MVPRPPPCTIALCTRLAITRPSARLSPWIHTGDSGIGITHGVAGALTIAPLILGRESRFAALFDPDRKPSASIPALSEFASGIAGAVRDFTEYVRPGDVASVEDLEPGQGAIIREGMLIHGLASRDKAEKRAGDLLEEVGVPVRKLAAECPGTILYRDPWQVVAKPRRDERLLFC